jgi:hypothetical protein
MRNTGVLHGSSSRSPPSWGTSAMVLLLGLRRLVGTSAMVLPGLAVLGGPPPWLFFQASAIWGDLRHGSCTSCRCRPPPLVLLKPPHAGGRGPAWHLHICIKSIFDYSLDLRLVFRWASAKLALVSAQLWACRGGPYVPTQHYSGVANTVSFIVVVASTTLASELQQPSCASRSSSCRPCSCTCPRLASGTTSGCKAKTKIRALVGNLKEVQWMGEAFVVKHLVCQASTPTPWAPRSRSSPPRSI